MIISCIAYQVSKREIEFYRSARIMLSRIPRSECRDNSDNHERSKNFDNKEFSKNSDIEKQQNSDKDEVLSKNSQDSGFHTDLPQYQDFFLDVSLD